MKAQRRLCGLLALCALATGEEAGAETEEDRHILTLERAQALARARAPRILAAKARVEVARGELAGASLFQPYNPALSFGAGPRRGSMETTFDAEVGLRQRFEIGGQRGARIDRAEAGVDRAKWEAEDAARRLVRAVSLAFFRALHAEEAVGVARESEALARELRRVAEKRHEVGDVGILDVHVAGMTFARAQAEVHRLEARYQASVGQLRALLGMEADAEVAVEGSLNDRQRYALDELAAEAPDRADLRALTAEVKEARAEKRLGEAKRWPDLGVFLQAGREEGAELARAGIAVHIPLFARGQGLRATGAARSRALSLELDASRRLVSARVKSAAEVYAILDQAAREFEEKALPRLEESLDLARRSYQVGNIAVGELLVLQREMVEARMAYVDLLLDAALAGIELEAAAGTL